MSEAPAAPIISDRDRYSLHPEDWVTQQESHLYEISYLLHGLRRVLPDCFVGGDMAIYWLPGQYRRPYVGADILVSRHQPTDPDPKVYLVHVDGPLTMVIEVASDRTRAYEQKKRDEDYALKLKVPEYVFMDLHRGVLGLYVLVGDRYEPVEPDAQGRVWSRELGIGFVWDEEGRKLIRIVTPEGELISTPEEETELRREAEARAAREARRAAQEAQRATREARRAEASAQRAEEEAGRAEEEARKRAEAEARAEALASELERLRRALEEERGQRD